MNNKIKFVALGGMDERGKDCYVIDIDDNLFVINAGISFLSTSTLGVSGLIPDFQYLEDNKSKIRGIFIGCANEDNIGALAFLNRKIENVPVFTSGVNIEILTDYFPNDAFNFKEVKANQGIDFNGVKVTFFKITNSIPGSCGILFQTSFGSNVIYLDDTIIGATNMPALNNDLLKMFGTLYDQNNYLLTKTGYISHKTGFNSPRYSVQNFFNRVLEGNKGRIITALYSYDIYKLIVLMILAGQKQRPVILFNAQTDNLVGALADEKFISEKLLSIITDVENTSKLSNAIVCIVNEPGKIFEQLQDIMEEHDEILQIKDTDTFIFGSSTING
jgi:ribonuclease J